MNQKANKLIKQKIEKLGLDHCEYPGCHNYDMLTISHRYPRRYYRTTEELADRSQWCAMCLSCHQRLDHTSEGIKEKEDIFNRVLGKDPFNIKKRK